MDYIKEIQKFEDLFVAGGKLALSRKKNVKSSNKYTSGIKDIDIVTEADLEVQEFVLNKLVDSELKNCEMVAEEDTPCRKKFAKNSDLVITLDPIDGTMLYATDRKMYSIIVTLHNKKDPLYTFVYFPEVDWGFKIVGEDIEYFGQKPIFPNVKNRQKTIVHFTSVDPKSYIPEIYQKMINEGYDFVVKSKVSDDIGSTSQFILGIVDGLYVENGSAVDCLVGLHFALANHFKIYRDIDISKTIISPHAGSEAYKGYYLALRNH